MSRSGKTATVEISPERCTRSRLLPPASTTKIRPRLLVTEFGLLSNAPPSGLVAASYALMSATARRWPEDETL